MRRLHAALCSLLAIPPLSAVADRFDTSVPMHQQPSGNYYVSASLGGAMATELLVDTGSGYVSLSRTTFRKIEGLPGTAFLRDIYGTLANGKIVKVPVYRVAAITLGECELRDVEVAVFANTDRDILGLSALRQVEPFALQLDPPMLLLSECAPSAELAAVAHSAISPAH